MNEARTFQAVNDEVLMNVIQLAKNQLVFVAPGVRLPVAKKLVEAAERIRANNGVISVVLDVSEQVCSEGYGDIEGLKFLQQASGDSGYLSAQEGVRIGLVIYDGNTLIYAPTPLYLEAEPEVAHGVPQLKQDNDNGEPKPVVKPNGILLPKAVPESLVEACVADGNDDRQEIGLEPVKDEEVKKVADQVAKNPPKPFDMTRQERVFRSKICFMELKLSDYRIATKKIELPSELFVFDSDTRKRLDSKFQVFNKEILPNDVRYERANGNTVDLSVDYIDKLIKDTRTNFLMNAGKWGTVMLKKRQDEFDAAVAEIIDMLKHYKEEVDKSVREIARASCERLAAEVCEKLVDAPPAKLKNRFSSADTRDKKIAIAKEIVASYCEKAIDAALKDFNPKMQKVEKAVTYETFMDKDFVSFLEKPDALGKDWKKTFFEEHDAVPEVKAEMDESC